MFYGLLRSNMGLDIRVFCSHLATQIDALSRFGPRTHFCWLVGTPLRPCGHHFGLMLTFLLLIFWYFWLPWGILGFLFLILHRWAFIFEHFGLHPLLLAPNTKIMQFRRGPRVQFWVGGTAKRKQLNIWLRCLFLRVKTAHPRAKKNKSQEISNCKHQYWSPRVRYHNQTIPYQPTKQPSTQLVSEPTSRPTNRPTSQPAS